MRLLLNLCEWCLFRWASALLLSLGAVSFFVLAVSLVLLPADYERLSQPLYLSVTQCQALPEPGRAVSLLWYMPQIDSKGWVHRLALHDLAGGRPPLTLAWPQVQPSCMTAGAAPGELYVGCWDGALWRVDVSRPDAAPERLAIRLRMAPQVMACSADRCWLAVLSPVALDLIDLRTGRSAWSLGGSEVRYLAMHPREPRLALSMAGGECLEVAAETGRTLRRVASFDYAAIQMAFSPDGRLLALATGGGGSLLLEWSTGHSAWPAAWSDCPHFSRAAIALFSPSGERLITGGRYIDSLAVWNLRTMRMECELSGHVRAINSVAFLDESRLVSCGADGTIRIWDLDGRRPPEVITLDVTGQAG